MQMMFGGLNFVKLVIFQNKGFNKPYTTQKMIKS